jgi:hypothetical protein
MKLCSYHQYGKMECWNIVDKIGNKFKLLKISSNPSFHYPIIPIGANPLT